jgi:CRISPR system Cascade subunit CasE
VHPTERLTGHRNGRSADHVTVAATLFEGVLKVTDVTKFATTLKDGIGRGKAYGCGLLSLAPLEHATDA